jgi:uncharacterized protein YkwD
VTIVALGAALTLQHSPAQAATTAPDQFEIPAATLRHSDLSTQHAPTAGGCLVTGSDLAAERFILGLLNRHRAAAGVRPLILSYALSDVSRAHSCDMAAHGWLSHVGSDGSTFFSRPANAGIAFSSVAENIGLTSGGDAGIAAIDAEMMAEPLVPSDHHWNIVNAASTHVGIGVVQARGQIWFTEDFIG